MALRDLKDIAIEYHTLTDNVIDDFYVPCLANATMYKRASGFFSSEILLQISVGLTKFIYNNGKIQLLISPKLTKEDYDAIEKGYNFKEYLSKKIVDSFNFDVDFFQKKDRFGLLSFLIENDILDIKIVAVDSPTAKAMFHEKVGILKDDNEDYVSFAGSSNETPNGMELNYENIDVFCSWKSEESLQRCFNKEFDFDCIWNNQKSHLITIPFPEVLKKKLLQFQKQDNNYSELDKEYIEKVVSERAKKQPYTKTCSFDDLHKYQQEAVQNWIDAGFHGIYDMATGTGKTFTAIGSILKLKEIKKRVAVIICCPFKHLVDQWKNETDKFGLNAFACYSGLNYHNQFKREALKFSEGRSDFFCAIVSMDSLLSEQNFELYKLNYENTLLVVDEAHNLGSTNRSLIMQVNVPYRLALSATIERYGDEEGTEKLIEFFNGVCYTYSLAQALQKGFLTPYYYHPIPVSLDDQEYTEYQEISKKISKEIAKGNFDMKNFSDKLKFLLIQRSRVVSGCKDKIEQLRSLLINKDFCNKNNMLVYCGAVNYSTENGKRRQIDVVADMMTNELGISSTKFTAEEDAKERKEILASFKREDTQALVAMKCLDEGVDVPSIDTAFILASTTNPKEYIQRRGRVLRKSPGKKYAVIYDFITLPHPLDTRGGYNPCDASLVLKEKKRIMEFATLCSNPTEVDDLIDLIDDNYDLTVIHEEDEI